MREGWRDVQLGDVCTLTKGSTPTQKAMPGPYPLVVTAAEPLSSDAYQFDGEAVCVPMVSSTGHGHASLKRVHHAKGKFAVANIITALEAKPQANLDMKFLWLLLDHGRNEIIVPLMRGTANVSLSQRSLASARISLPPLEEQRRIVDLIEALDDTIVTAERASSRVRGLLAARRGQLLSAPQSRPASEVFDILIGLQRSPQRAEGPYQTNYLRSANVLPGRLQLADVKKMSFTPEQQAKYSLMPGDVLVSEGSASAEAVGAPSVYCGELDGIVCFQNTLLRYRAIESLTTPEFVAQWCHWAYESGAFREAANGTNIKHIGSRGAAKMLVPTLSIEEQERITNELDSAQSAFEASQETVTQLQSLRTNLLTTLLSGEHTIPQSYDEILGEMVLAAP